LLSRKEVIIVQHLGKVARQKIFCHGPPLVAILLAVGLILAWTVPAGAVPFARQETFGLELHVYNDPDSPSGKNIELIEGLYTYGTGWEYTTGPPENTGGQGDWIHYPATGNIPQGGYWPGFWNQWFYNGPDILGNWKRMTYEIFIDATHITSSTQCAWIALNWTQPWYDDPLAPPMPMTDPDTGEPVLNPAIVRETILLECPFNWPAGTQSLTGELIIPDYNPMWVSIDIQMCTNTNVCETMYFTGKLYHECVPEPLTMAGLFMGVGGLAGYIRKRRMA
jgi:hypothetical protein